MTSIISHTSQKQKETLGNFLKQKRLSTKTSVSILCSKISRSSSYYYRLEKGDIPLKASVIKVLFNYYGVKYDCSA